MYLKATIEVLLDVTDETEGSDAMSETMRPLLREFAGPESCVIDWRYHSSNVLPNWDTGEGFDYADPEKVAVNVKLPPLDKIKTGGITAYWVGESKPSQKDIEAWRFAVISGFTELGLQQWFEAQPSKIMLDIKLKQAERTLTWVAEWFKTRADENTEEVYLADSVQVTFALETVREVIDDDSRQKLAEIRTFAKAQNDKMDDAMNDGHDATPPTGDDWNELYSAIMG